jgi:hypothetical protein
MTLVVALLAASLAGAHAVHAGGIQPQISLCGPRPPLPSSSECFTRWVCDGYAWEPSGFKAAGTSCNDYSACTYSDKCDGRGNCIGTPITCTSDTCATRACNGTSSCTVSYATSSTTCNDANACTFGDHCNGSGTCVGTAITCASDTCATRACNGTSSCTVSYASSSTTCNDANACTYGDHCNGSGTCVGTPVGCASRGPCEQIQCDGTSWCAVTMLARGTACSPPETCSQVCDGVSPYCQPAE